MATTKLGEGMSEEENQVIKLMREKLEESLAPDQMNIIDESHLHEGHPGAIESGGGHYNLDITSEAFAGKTTLERHKMIYLALGEIMGTGIHALSIKAKTAEENDKEIESPEEEQTEN